MRILLVEPAYRRCKPKEATAPSAVDVDDIPKPAGSDATLWYPPLGLMKLACFHKARGDDVQFVSGCDHSLLDNQKLLSLGSLWDRVYITTLFTFHYDKIIETIKFYKQAVGGTAGKIFVGGVMASMMADDIFRDTGVYPCCGALTSPSQIGLEGKTNIDQLPPDYGILDPKVYGINDTYYWYASRGCVRKCPWCAVPQIEPTFESYFDIRPIIKRLRRDYGDKTHLKLMDNNIMASPTLKKTVDDLLELGYGKEQLPKTGPSRLRSVDFNQGMDAAYFTEEKAKLISQINVRPVRLAFDRASGEKVYSRAVELAHKYGLLEFSNYMLYNFKDTPRDLFERITVNIEFNEKMRTHPHNGEYGKIYCYPMRYAPIDKNGDRSTNRQRDYVAPVAVESRDWVTDPAWTRRFIRNIEIMKGAAHGAISPTPSLARRTVGETFEEFVQNLYMPEELLRNRNKHEKRVYPSRRKARPGTGKIEAFRQFISDLLQEQGTRFAFFHNAVSLNSAKAVRECVAKCTDKEMKKWLRLYLKR